MEIARIKREDTTGYWRDPISAILALVLVSEKYTVAVVPHTGGVTTVFVSLISSEPRRPSRTTTAWSNQSVPSLTGPGATGTRTFGTCGFAGYKCTVGAGYSRRMGSSCNFFTPSASLGMRVAFLSGSVVFSLSTSARSDIRQLNV